MNETPYCFLILDLYAPASGKTHLTINREIGQPDDMPTQEIFKFLNSIRDSAEDC